MGDPSGPSVRPESKGRVLVVDDQRNMRATTAMLLRAEGYEVDEAGGGEEALALLSSRPIDVMLTDLKMEPIDGLSLLKRALEVAPQTQVIVMTAYGSIESAVEAMRNGAYSYVTKPFKEGELVHWMKKALERAHLLSQVDLFTGEFNQAHGLSSLVGRSQAMRDLNGRLTRVAPSDATVFILGESGTGKELVARAVHTLSRRRTKPFVAINCAAITESLLESELFGHAKGAFTGAVKTRRGLFQEADGGTLFIDEVTETATSFQSKLLRVLQEGEVRRVGESASIKVDVRIVAATNRDIEREVAEKRFRQDLFYRLNVVNLVVPPLRDRLDDVPLLAEHFLQKANERNARKHRLSQASIEHLMGYDFPGNVRELENLVEQAAAMSEAEEIMPSDFPLRPRARIEAAAGRSTPTTELPIPMGTLADSVNEAERRAISAALDKSPTDLGRVADQLGISATTLWRKMKRLGLKTSASEPAS